MKFRIKDTDSTQYKAKEKEKLNNKIYNLKNKKSRNVDINNNKDFSINYYGFNNTVSTHIKTKYDIDEENTIPDYDVLLNSIIQLLSDLNRQEQKVFLNSTKMLKKLINKMRKGIIKKEKKDEKIDKEKRKNRYNGNDNDNDNDNESNYS